MGLNVNNVDTPVPNASTSILAALPGQSITFLKVTAVNTDTVPHTLTVNRVPMGGGATTANELISAMPIGAGETVTLPLSGQSLVAQQSLYAVASVAAEINLNIGYASSP